MKTRIPALSIDLLLGLAAAVGLYLISLYSYLLFHSLAELLSIAIAWSVFLLAWNARRFLDNGYLLLVGVALFFIGGIDLLHTLSFKGMGVLDANDANLATQLWVGARYVQSLTLLLAPLLLRRRLSARLVFVVYSVITALLLASIFYWRVFPAAYVEGSGLTPFKIVSENIIALILLASLVLLIRVREAFDPLVSRLLAFAIVASIVSELFFTAYLSVYDTANLLGHFLKILAFFCFYKAFIETGLNRPYDLIFKDLKEREEALKQANAELENRVADIRGLNEALQERAAELEAANQELSAFSYSVSHDLRSPLTVLDGTAQLLERDYAASMDEKGRHYIARLREGSARMEQLIQDLLSLSRATRGELHRERVDLTALACAVADDLCQREPGRRIQFDVAPGLIANADPRLLRVLLENLMTNAVKFSAPRPEAKVEVGRLPGDKGADTFFVRDNGVGFDMARATRLFEPFQRLHSGEQFPGSGIGLATVQRIAARHGGRAWAESAPDRGATFYFTLGAYRA